MLGNKNTYIYIIHIINVYMVLLVRSRMGRTPRRFRRYNLSYDNMYMIYYIYSLL